MPLAKPYNKMSNNTSQQITWSDFQKIEMRVGTIIQAEPFKETRNPSLKLWIDFGPLGIKKTSAQITTLYQSENLINKQVIAVVNFPPKQIANIQSQCLVLGCIGNENMVTLIQPDQKVENGLRIG